MRDDEQRCKPGGPWCGMLDTFLDTSANATEFIVRSDGRVAFRFLPAAPGEPLNYCPWCGENLNPGGPR